jgi:uncharacterized protein
MDIILNDTEVRILGCLIEKELTTPEYYPLSLNSLTTACNQKSNRSPVVSYDEPVVLHGLESLKEMGLLRETHMAGSRVPKYLHTLLDKFDFSRHEIAILCELLLRGPQTIGEIRIHAERMVMFEGLQEVENTLQFLMDYAPALALKLPREKGRKECRYMHLLSGNLPTEKTIHGLPVFSATHQGSLQERVSKLEEENIQLKSELNELKQAFAEFKLQC